MDRRGRHGELYAIVILFVFPIGVGLWALDRRRPLGGAADDVVDEDEVVGPEGSGPAEDGRTQDGAAVPDAPDPASPAS